MNETTPPLLEVRGLQKLFPIAKGFFGRISGHVRAVDGVDVVVHESETVGLVGESGSGKSTLARCIVRLLDPDHGSIRLGDTDLAKLSRRAMRRESKRIQMVFQDPFGSLNPRRRAGSADETGSRSDG